jgi:hypothetical protein
LPHTPLETHFEDSEPGKLKEKLLEGESDENKALRKEFFSKLNDYLAEIRGGK